VVRQISRSSTSLVERTSVARRPQPTPYLHPRSNCQEKHSTSLPAYGNSTLPPSNFNTLASPESNVADRHPSSSKVASSRKITSILGPFPMVQESTHASALDHHQLNYIRRRHPPWSFNPGAQFLNYIPSNYQVCVASAISA
jgi:hypothetical protein